MYQVGLRRAQISVVCGGIATARGDLGCYSLLFQSHWRGRVMRKFFLGSTALVGLIAGPAIAADLAVKAPVYKGPSPPVVIYSWTGCYIGANIGGGWARKSWTTTTPPPP